MLSLQFELCFSVILVQLPWGGKLQRTNKVFGLYPVVISRSMHIYSTTPTCCDVELMRLWLYFHILSLLWYNYSHLKVIFSESFLKSRKSLVVRTIDIQHVTNSFITYFMIDCMLCLTLDLTKLTDHIYEAIVIDLKRQSLSRIT